MKFGLYKVKTASTHAMKAYTECVGIGAFILIPATGWR